MLRARAACEPVTAIAQLYVRLGKDNDGAKAEASALKAFFEADHGS